LLGGSALIKFALEHESKFSRRDFIALVCFDKFSIVSENNGEPDLFG
jgi:hypothetical protein